MTKPDKTKLGLTMPASPPPTAPAHRPARPAWQTPMGRITRNPRGPAGRSVTVPRRPGHR
jgi:hypothetical protein